MQPEALKTFFRELREDPEITTYLRVADEHLREMGYTDHGLRHCRLVSDIARNVMKRLNRTQEEQDLAGIAGYLHDIGNLVNRRDHATAGAVMAWRILKERGLSWEQIAKVAGAIGNHEEAYGKTVNSVSAALILADKSDVHRTRVRAEGSQPLDIHDRVNYAANESFLDVNPGARTITLRIQIDTDISPVMDYFEIFLTRMMMCRRAAEFLGQNFELDINGMHLL